MLGIPEALTAAAAMALTVLACRALPFLFFAGRKTPPALAFLETYMPVIAMVVLTTASYTSLKWKSPPHGIPEVAAGLVVALLHLWKKNALLSIIGGTMLYMTLSAAL